MRKILFRGRRTDNGQWVYGFLWVNRTVTRETVYITNVMGELFQVHPETVGQYTGLNDKNWQRIFEGDIISYLHDGWIEPEVGVVKYMSDDGYPAFELEHSPVFDDEHYVVECNMLALLDQSGDYSYFVAGNIHDDPELMGETK